MGAHRVLLQGAVRGRIVRVGAFDMGVAEFDVRHARGAPFAIGDAVVLGDGGDADPMGQPVARLHIPEVIPVALGIAVSLLMGR